MNKVSNAQQRTGVFVGSFDPFTIGHADIVNRALPLFDRIVIGVGVNERKQYMLTAEERCRRISELYLRCRHITTSPLTSRIAQAHVIL